MVVASRTYVSPLRQQRAEENRLRVIEAAADLFAERGYSGARLCDIAERAGVSEGTVRAAGSRSFLLLEAFRTRYAGSGGWESLDEQEAARSIYDIDVPEAAMEAVVDFLARGHAASAGLWVVIRAAALTDGEVAAGFAELVQLKGESFLHTTRWMIRLGLLPEPVDDDALRLLTDQVTVAMSAESYLLLTEDHRLDDGQYRSWLRRRLRGLGP